MSKSDFTKTIIFLVFFIIYRLILPPVTYAYLDLGTSSFFIQTLLVVLFGAILTIKMFWNNIRNFFSNFFSKQQKIKNDQKEQ